MNVFALGKFIKAVNLICVFFLSVGYISIKILAKRA